VIKPSPIIQYKLNKSNKKLRRNLSDVHLFIKPVCNTRDMGIEIRKILQNEFPAKLREIPQPPEALWLRGTMPSEETKLLAVVGSRALTRYGREACEMLLAGLAGYPISIVSGLALGADACAHKAALCAALHTIAIPGSSVDDHSIGPRSNLGLAHQILNSGGALLSEHETGYLAHPYDFPSRNRIMAGLADAVLIIESGPKSGTLITARLATEYNRDLLCVPHRIGDSHGFGFELFSRLGAAIVTEPKHILEALGIEPRDESDQLAALMHSAMETMNRNERTLYELLETPQQRDALIRSAGLPAGETLTTLISLEFKGLVKEEFGAWRRSNTASLLDHPI
jgi:DNA processing protein